MGSAPDAKAISWKMPISRISVIAQRQEGALLRFPSASRISPMPNSGTKKGGPNARMIRSISAGIDESSQAEDVTDFRHPPGASRQERVEQCQSQGNQQAGRSAEQHTPKQRAATQYRLGFVVRSRSVHGCIDDPQPSHQQAAGDEGYASPTLVRGIHAHFAFRCPLMELFNHFTIAQHHRRRRPQRVLDFRHRIRMPHQVYDRSALLASALIRAR